MSKHNQRNWSQYNQRLRAHSRIEVFVSRESLSAWGYGGKRRPGGKRLYGDVAVEACLLIREYFGLALRQTEGFVQSLLDMAGAPLKAPDYTTLSRRCGGLGVRPMCPTYGEGMVIAIDSTGLSLYSASSWHRAKHRRGAHNNEHWRKLHVAIDTATGMIVAADYSEATSNDCVHLPGLLDAVRGPVQAVAADMAYDTHRCRQAVHARGARQLIPPRRNARLSHLIPKHRRCAGAPDTLPDTLKERDDAILFLRHNAVNGNPAIARKSWKQKTGYHVRSRVETTFSQIKTHSSDRLTNKTEANRKAQAILKCTLLNILNAL